VIKLQLPNDQMPPGIYAYHALNVYIDSLPALYNKMGIGSKKTLVLKIFIDQFLERTEKAFKETPTLILDEMRKKQLAALEKQ